MSKTENYVGGGAEGGEDWYLPEVATFGDRLAAAREQAGLTVADISKRLGVKKSTMTAWEDDLNEPRANKLQMLSGILGVSMRWLLTGEGSAEEALNQNPVDFETASLLNEIRDIRVQMLAATERLARLEKKIRR